MCNCKKSVNPRYIYMGKLQALFLILLCSTLSRIHGKITSTSQYEFSKQRKTVSNLFIFGDSFFDPGNNNYINTSTLDQANFWPYGETYFHYPTGRFSDGRLISDFIAQHAKLPLIPPYLQPRRGRDQQKHIHYHGINFASAGAGALPDTFKGSVIDLGTQLEYYKKEMRRLRKRIGDVDANTLASSAVYLFSIGTNDYISPFILNSTVSLPSQYVEMVIGNFTRVVKEVYERGARKFVFLNLGNLGCLPGLRTLTAKGRCLKEASVLAQIHNTVLKISVSQMDRDLHGFKHFLYDFNISLAQKTNQPFKYGLKNGKKACCGTGRFNGVFSCGGKRPVKEFELCENPSEFVFWDSYHLTENVYKQMAYEMWSKGLHRFFHYS